MKNIIYFFNYYEWIAVILDCWLFTYLTGQVNGEEFLVFWISLICVILFLFIIAARFEREFYGCNAYKYKCVYKVNQLTIDKKIYYVPTIVVYTHVGSRYIRLINNTNNSHLSDSSFCYSSS